MDPVTGWPEAVIDELDGRVDGITENERVVEFYIGRTNNLNASLSRHDADDILPLYQTDSVDNAMDVEAVLLEKYITHPKCSNEVDDERGGVAEGDMQFVYVCVWLDD